MSHRQPFDGMELAERGLNLQAVFDLETLPVEIVSQLRQATPHLDRYTQLVLLGHGGKLLWEHVRSAGMPSDDPIDDYSRSLTQAFFARRYDPAAYELLFPKANQAIIGLQALGKLAGWHHGTPMRIGINAGWGSWFAYRAVVLVKGDYQPTLPLVGSSPCETCVEQACLQACPAMRDGTPEGSAEPPAGLDIMRCIAERKRDDSECQDRCLARLACPVATEHRYTPE